MSVDTKLVDELLKGCTTVESIAGAKGLLKQWTKALVEHALARLWRPDSVAYARGMTVREIQDHLEEMYQVEVSPALISNVTEAVMDEARERQSRPVMGWTRPKLLRECVSSLHHGCSTDWDAI